MVEPDVNRVVVQVYDVVDKLEGVAAIMDVQRFEARSDTLEVKQLVTLRNASKPPRTLMNDRPFEVQLPPEAQVKSGLVQIEDGQPLRDKPAPGEHKGEYYFRYPLRPGDTRFAVVYQLPYSGKAVFEPKIRNAQERFVVMLPKSMRFEQRAQASSGGGPGPPPKSPGPLQNHDSFILWGLTVVLTAGTVYLYVRRRSAVARARVRNTA